MRGSAYPSSSNARVSCWEAITTAAMMRREDEDEPDDPHDPAALARQRGNQEWQQHEWRKCDQPKGDLGHLVLDHRRADAQHQSRQEYNSCGNGPARIGLSNPGRGGNAEHGKAEDDRNVHEVFAYAAWIKTTEVAKKASPR